MRTGQGNYFILKVSLAILFVVYILFFFFMAGLTGPYDYDHLSAYYELAWRFWYTQSGLPHFNPFFCGGRTLGADPQVPVFSPLTFLVPWLGPTILLKWEMLAQLALGLYGLVSWLRMWKVSRLGIIWAVFLYIGGGAIVSRFMIGHVTLGFLILFPYFLYLSYRLDEAQGYQRAKLLFIYCLLCVYCGMYKPNFLIQGAPLLAIEAAFRSLFRRSLRPLVHFTVGMMGCGLCNAVGYYPAWQYFGQFPRLDGTQPLFIPPYALLANIVIPLKGIPEALYGSGFMQRHEYSIFISPLALGFAVIALFSPLSRSTPERKALLALMVFSCLLGFGSLHEGFSWWLPYTWFRPFWPGFQSIRVPVRFWYGAYLALIVFSAMAFRAPGRKWEKAVWFGLGILPVLLSAFVNLSKPVMWAYTTQWKEPRAFPKDIVLEKDHPDFSYEYVWKGIGTWDCSYNIEVYKAKKLQPGRSLLKITPGGLPVFAEWLSWSKVKIQGELSEPTRFSFNMNHSPFWEFRGQGNLRVVSSFHDLLSLEGDAGVWEGELVFVQPWVKEGLWISLTGWGLMLIWGGLLLVWRKRRGWTSD